MNHHPIFYLPTVVNVVVRKFIMYGYGNLLRFSDMIHTKQATLQARTVSQCAVFMKVQKKNEPEPAAFKMM